MNKFSAFSLLAAVIAVSPCCEQQSYEETKMFNQSPHPAQHGDSHGSGHTESAAPAPENH